MAERRKRNLGTLPTATPANPFFSQRGKPAPRAQNLAFASRFYGQTLPTLGGEIVFSGGVAPVAAIGPAAGRYALARFPALGRLVGQAAPKVAKAVTTVAKNPVAEKLIQALKEAKPIRAEQEALYSAERSRRLGKALAVSEEVPGEAGARKMLGALRGELPKAQFESVRPRFAQAEVDELFNQVKSSPLLPGYSKAHAITGLTKLLHPTGVGVPQESELKLLARVFGPQFIKEVQRERGAIGTIIEAAAIPRALAATLDLSAPLRQGLVAGVRYPRQFIKAFGTMFKSAASEEAFTALKQQIVSRPTFRLMDEAGLALTGLDEGVLLAREEQWISRLPERLPVVGGLIRGSNRAYTGFLTKLRADVFDELLKRAQAAGVPQTEELLSGIAKFVNSATGRGSLGSFSGAGKALGTVLFSPRLLAARLNMLNPLYYQSLPPMVRKEALKAMLNLAALGTTVVGVAKLAGARVGVDPRNADFGKIRIRDTRLDVWGGFQQYPRIAAQMATGKLISSTTGKETVLGEGYRPLTRKDIAFRFFESKANPLVGTILELMEGRTFEGGKPGLTTTAKRLLVPMILQDVYDLARDDPELLPLMIPGVFGASVQTYGSTDTGRRKRTLRH